MRLRSLCSISALLVISSSALAESNADIEAQLSPAGSFHAHTAKVTGEATKNGDGVMAENVIVDINSLETGIALRDKHLKEHLKSQQYPQAKLIKAIGKGGKGKANIEIMGKKIQVAGTYKIEGEMLRAEFPVHLHEVDINGVRYMGVGVKDDVILRVTIPVKAK